MRAVCLQCFLLYNRLSSRGFRAYCKQEQVYSTHALYEHARPLSRGRARRPSSCSFFTRTDVLIITTFAQHSSCRRRTINNNYIIARHTLLLLLLLHIIVSVARAVRVARRTADGGPQSSTSVVIPHCSYIMLCMRGNVESMWLKCLYET